MNYENLPSNSNKTRLKQEKEGGEIRRVEAGVVKSRKKNAFKRAANLLIEDDLDSVKRYILIDVLLPSIKSAIVDMVNGALEMLFYGTAKGRRSKSSSGSSASYTSYYQSDKKTTRASSVVNELYDYEDHIFETREGAEDFLLSLKEYLSRYGYVSVNEYYDAVGKHRSFTDEKYGWTNLDGVKVKHIRDGWIVDLPRAEEID